MLAAPAGGNVLVFDIKNGNLRKFAVILIEDFDGGPLGWIAEDITPSQDNWDYFYSLDQVKNKVSPSLEVFCGPGSGFGEFIVPDLNILVDVAACRDHDDCYAEGGDESDREQCDEDFQDDLMLLTNPSAAEFYYRMVRIFGSGSFNYWGPGGLLCIFEDCDQYENFTKP